MLLRQQSYAIKNQLVAKISCSSLVLYGIRIVGFHEQKGPIMCANETAGYISIKAGEQIVTSYKNPLLGSVARRSHFPRVWYFHCSCPRCSDPTELGSHLSSLRCGECGESVLPSHPTHYNSPWSCSACSLTISAHQAEWRALIGPDTSRYSPLIGGHLTMP